MVKRPQCRQTSLVKISSGFFVETMNGKGAHMVEGMALVQGVQLPLEAPSVEEASNFALANLGVHAGVDALKDTGHPNEDSRFQLPNVIHEALDVPSPVPETSA